MAREIYKFTPSGVVVYATIRRVPDATVWNGAGFETWADVNLPNYAIVLTDEGGDLYTTDFPVLITTPGQYYASFYIREGALPANDDFKLPGDLVIEWTGSGVVSEAHYSAISDVKLELLGNSNYNVHADGENNQLAQDIAENGENALDQSDVRVNLKLSAPTTSGETPVTLQAPLTFPVTSSLAWVTSTIRMAATKYAAGYLLNFRTKQAGAAPTTPTNGDLKIAEGDELLQMLINAGLPGITLEPVDPEAEAEAGGGFTFAPINRDVCDATGDENHRPLLWY